MNIYNQTGRRLVFQENESTVVVEKFEAVTNVPEGHLVIVDNNRYIVISKNGELITSNSLDDTVLLEYIKVLLQQYNQNTSDKYGLYPLVP